MVQVVLVHPQIPPNTGNVARTCAATDTPLHLVAPLGFELSDRYLKRAGLDYWPYVDLTVHASWQDFLAHVQTTAGRCLGFAPRATDDYLQIAYQSGDWLLFGSETEGLSATQLQACQATVRIPMRQPRVRSLNLSVSVAIALFESQRQLGLLGD
ncbi:MAG: tRNA (cytidine(34)-2'-O)-methyltransferase [Gloeomargaritaceae cyanobacterium C42_A2020_066]|nr:tRNA (cytidine(34)-2'-O)-methyltransferase [Gloeomargaritaceae cyanobacterium C42_A2020_066]